MFAKIKLGVISLVAAGSAANAVHVILGGTRAIVQTRLDPIANPGALSTHVHDVFGASGFADTLDYDKLIQSKCSTTVIPQDLSNYWVPSMYHVGANGEYTLMKSSMNIYYLIRPGPKNDKIQPFPKGLRMLAGSNTRGVYNASNPEDNAVSYVCLDYKGGHDNDPAWAERPTFFEHQCPDGMRAQVFFPSCWDGKNLDSPDHKSHMAYPTGAFNNGECPPSHPVHLISLFYELVAPTGDFDYHGLGSWILSNGDPKGLRFHGDFFMGWKDTSLLDNLINNCPNAAGNVADCPALKAVMDPDAAAACQYEGMLVQEDIGVSSAITALPGCNQPWDGSGAQPACSGGSTVKAPSLGAAVSPLPSGWSDLGCIAEGTNGRALTGAQYMGFTTNMTKVLCSTLCSAFTYAGVEYGQECYCGNSLANGASTATVAAEQCNSRCSGNSYETCGGLRRLQLLQNANPGSPPAQPATSIIPAVVSSSTVPATSPNAVTLVNPPASTPSVTVPETPVKTNGTWTPAGCVTDGSSRALTGYSFSAPNMTPQLCQSACAAKGFTIAGVEFSTECYCGSSFANNLGAAATDNHCYMSCSGDKSLKCGGTWAMNVFKQSAVGKRSQYRGRAHHRRVSW